MTVEADDEQEAIEAAEEKASHLPIEALTYVDGTDTQAVPIVRKFKKGQEVFINDTMEPDLRGFGKILVDTETTEDDNIVLNQVNKSGENEEDAGNIYKLAEGKICRKCGCVVCVEHKNFTSDSDLPDSHNYPYYCPKCDENLFHFEVEDTDDYENCLQRSKDEFEKMAYDYLNEE